MSKVTDEKVVQIQFDNQQFEKNVKTSIDSIDHLKKSLQFDESGKSFKSIEDAASKVSFSKLNDSIDSVKVKFSALETIAITTLANITNKAVDAGAQLVKSLSTDNISSGWKKYEEMTTAVGTLISQGFDMETVTGYMEQLNWFTDETSYNLTDMVKHIGSFTATGKSLDDSVEAMEGIATWAALSGKNAAVASSLMRQLAQAISRPFNKLDWSSITTAGMDNAEFRIRLLQAAVEEGRASVVNGSNEIFLTTLKQMREAGKTASEIKEYMDTITFHSNVGTGAKDDIDFGMGNLTDSLAAGRWLDPAVQMNVYRQYGAAIADIYEYAEEKGITASQAIEELNGKVDEFGLKAFIAAQEARTWTDTIDSVKDAVSTGWMTTFQTIFGNYEEAKVLWTDMANSLWNVFAGPISDRNEMLAEWKELGGRDDIIDAFWNIFGDYDEVEKKYTGLVGLIQIVKEAFQEIFPPKTAEDFKKITERIRDWTERFKFSEDQVNNFRDAIKGVLSIFKVLGQVIKALLSPFKLLKNTGGSFIDVLASIAGWIGRLLSGFANWLSDNDILVNAVKGLMAVIGGAIKLIELLFTKITGLTFKQFGEKIKNAFGSLSDFLKGVGDKIKDFFSGIGGIDIKAELGNFATGFGEGVRNGFGKVVGVFDKVKNAVGKFFDKVKEVFSKLPKIDFTGANTFSEKVKRVFEPIKTLFEKLKDGVEWVWGIIKKVFGKVKDIFKAVVSFVKDIFGKATDEVNKIDWNKVSSVLKTIFEIIKGFISLGIYKNINDLIKSTKGLVDGIKHIGDTFSSTLKQIADAFDGAKKKVKSEQVKDIAESILMVAAAMFILALLPEEKLKAAGIALGIATTALIGVFIGMDKATKHSSSKRLYTLTTAMLKLAEAIAVIAIAIRLIGNLDPGKVATAAIALSLTLGALSGAVVGLDKATKGDTSTRITKLAETIVILSAALAIISASIKHIAKLDPLKVATSAGVLVLVLGSLIVAVIALDKETKGSQSPRIMKLAETIVILSAAMAILSASIKHIAKLDPKGVAVATAALAAMLLALVVAIKLMPKDKDLTKSSGALLALAGAVAIIAVAMRILAKLSWDELVRSVVAFAAILTGLVIAMNAVQATSLKGALGMLIIAAAMAVMVPVLLSFGLMPWPVIGKGLLTLAGVLVIFVAAAYALTPVVGTLVAFGAAMLMLGGSVLAFATGVAILAAAIPLFATSMAIFGDLVIDGIIKIIEAIPRMISAFVLSIIQSAEDIVTGLVELIRIVLQAITTLLPEIVSMLVNMLLNIIKATIIALADHAYEIVSEFVRLIKEILRAIVDAFKDVSFDEIVEVVLALVGALGVLGLLVPVIATAVLITSMLPIIGLNLSAFAASIIPFLAILSTVNPKTFESAKLLADTVLEFTAASLIDGIASWITGGSDYTKFAEQLGIIGTGLNNFSNNTKDVDVDKVKTAAEATKILADVATNLPYQSNSLAGWIAGKVTLSDFAQQMGDFAEPFNKFIEGISGTDINLDQVATVCSATTIMSNLAKDLPFQSGAVLSWIVGSKMSLTDFAQEMEWFAPHFNEFIKKISNTNVNLQKVQIVSLATKIMTSVTNNLPHQGNGLISWIVGSKMTLTDFAQELEWFAPHFNEFVKKTSSTNVVTSRVKGIAKAVLEMTKVANELPTAGDGIKSWFVGKTLSLTDFAQEMEWAGPHFANFISSTSSMTGSTTQAKEVATTVMEMIKVANELPTSGDGIISWFTGKKLSLTDFAQEMEWAGPHFANFASSISGVTVDTDAMTGIVSAITEMIKVSNDLPSAQNGFLSWFLSTRQLSLSQFADEMSVAAPKFKDFCESISGMTLGEGSDEKAAFLMTIINGMLTACESMPKASDGLIGIITGSDMTLSQFGAQLALFGPQYKTFVESFSSISHADLVKGAMAIKPMEHLGTFMTALSTLDSDNWVSVMDVLVGKQKSLSEFGAELEEFAPHYKVFVETFGDITGDPDTITNVLSSMTPLSDLLDTFDKWRKKSIWDYLFKEDKPLSKFASELESFGSHLSVAASSIASCNLTLNKVAPVKELVEVMISLIEAMDKSYDENSGFLITTYGENLKTFAGSLKGFFDTFFDNPLWRNGNGLVLINTVIDTISSLVDVSIKVLETLSALNDVDSEKVAKTSGEFTTFITGMRQLIIAFAHGEEGLDNDTITKFDEFIRNLIQIAKDAAAVNVDDVTAVIESLTGIPAESIKKMIEDVEAAPGRMTEAVNNLMDACKNAIETKGAEAKTAFNGFIASFKNKLTSINTQLELKSVGVAIMNCIKEGISGQQNDLETTIKTLLDTIFTDTKDYVETDDVKTKLKNISNSIVDGIKTGLDDKKGDLKKKGEELANLVSDSFSETLEINSPSKVMMKLGEFIGEGLVIGIESYDGMVRKTSSDLGTAAERGLAEAMNRIQDVIMSDPDDTLTIRPVLDLSEIQNGTKRLYSMMPNSDSFSIYGDYGMAEEIAGRVRSAELAKNVDPNGTINKDTSDKNNPGQTFNNTFNIQGEDPRAIATEVSRIIQRQTERKEAVWGS